MKKEECKKSVLAKEQFILSSLEDFPNNAIVIVKDKNNEIIEMRIIPNKDIINLKESIQKIKTND